MRLRRQKASVPPVGGGWRTGGMVVITCVLCSLVLAPAAAGATRYASPTGTANPSCSQTMPCDAETAVEGAGVGDEVIVGPGNHVLADQITFFAPGLTVHGMQGAPRPRLIGAAASLVVQEGGVARDLEVHHTGSGTAVSVAEATAERLLVFSDGNEACELRLNALVRNTVCRLTNDAGRAAVELGIGGSPGSFVETATLRNVTGFSAGASAIRVSAGNNAQLTINAVNTIARATGGAPDVLAEVTGIEGTRGATVNLDHSNYATVETVPGTTGAPATVTPPGSGANQTAGPLFANAAAGDFHERAGSPTIDAGVTTAANGPFDLDRQARAQGASTDIGADEFAIAPPPGGGPSNDFSFGKVKKNRKKGTAKLAVLVPGAGEVDLAKSKKVKPKDKSADRAGKLKLPIKPKRKAKKKLSKKGKAAVKAEVTYIPDGGEPNTQSKRIGLKKRV